MKKSFSLPVWFWIVCMTAGGGCCIEISRVWTKPFYVEIQGDEPSPGRLNPMITDLKELVNQIPHHDPAPLPAVMIMDGRGDTRDIDWGNIKIETDRPDRLNSAFYFADGVSSKDSSESAAGQVYRRLSQRDSAWAQELYGLAGISPGEMAGRLGIAAPPVSEWNRVNVRFRNGDGTPVSGYSNAKEILSLASVYGYFHQWTDQESFWSYADRLWSASHSYHISMSDVYYCEGDCKYIEDSMEEEDNNEAVNTENSGNSGQAQSSSEGASTNVSGESGNGQSWQNMYGESAPEETESGEQETSGNSEGNTGAESQEESGEQNGPGVTEGEPDVQSSSAKEDNAAAEQERSAGTEGGAAGQESAAGIGDGAAGQESAAGIGDGVAGQESIAGIGDEAAGQEGAAGTEAGTDIQEGSDGIRAGTGGQESSAGIGEGTGSQEGSVGDGTAGQGGTGGTEAGTGSQEDPVGGGTDGQYGTDGTEGGGQEASQTYSSSMSEGQDIAESTEDSKQPKRAGKKHCQGHIDLNISAQIIGLDENRNLCAADQKGSKADAENLWKGWEPETVSYARAIADQDWYDLYGLTSSASMYVRNPLSASEVAYYLNMVPEGTSPKRREVIRQALLSIGAIPYYWGGKPRTAGLEGNGFGSVVSPDEDGRNLRGLDCSGWINWVYWTALGSPLPYESTSGLMLCGRGISKEELQAGDILIKTGENRHVYMFLAWAGEGSMYLIHETTGTVNNVMIDIYDLDLPYYRSLIEE